MKPYFHKDKMPIGPFVKRFVDPFGNEHEKKTDKPPRGDAYRRLGAIEWRAHHKKRELAGYGAKIIVSAGYDHKELAKINCQRGPEKSPS